MLVSKNQQVRDLVKIKEYKKALQICKDWDYKDPEHRRILRTGYDCLMYPKFYEQLGYDVKSKYDEAVRVLEELYGASR